MPDLKIPPHPTHDYFCGNCKYWLKSEGQNIAYLQTGGGIQMMPVAELIKQGQQVSDLVTARVAPCTKFPKWETAPKQHWCHQYESAPTERVVKNDAGKFGDVIGGDDWSAGKNTLCQHTNPRRWPSGLEECKDCGRQMP